MKTTKDGSRSPFEFEEEVMREWHKRLTGARTIPECFLIIYPHKMDEKHFFLN